MMFWMKQDPCARAQALLDRYFCGDLSSPAVREVDLHLSACGSCRREMQVLERVVVMVEGLDRRVPPRDLWVRIEQEIRQPASRFLIWPADRSLPAVGMGWRISGALAATAAVAAVGWSTFWPHSPGSQNTMFAATPPSAGAPMAAASPMAASIYAAPAASMRSEPTPFVSQAEEASFFDPLTDKASLVAMVEATNHSPGTGNSQLPIDDSMAGGSLR